MIKTDEKSLTKKRTYHPPCLICYGDIRDITLGGSLGVGDSLGRESSSSGRSPGRRNDPVPPPLRRNP